MSLVLPGLVVSNQRHLVSKMSSGVIHEQKVTNVSFTGLPTNPNAAAAPKAAPKVRRAASSPVANVPEFPAGSSGISKATNLAALTPRSLTRRKSSISVFWFFAMSRHGNAVEVHGGGKDDMDKRYNKCPNRKVKWKALLNVSSNNIKKTEVVEREPRTVHRKTIADAVMSGLDAYVMGTKRSAGSLPTSIKSLANGFRRMYMKKSLQKIQYKLMEMENYTTRTYRFDYVPGPFGMVLRQTKGVRLRFTDGGAVQTIVKSVRSGSVADERGICYGMWLYQINDWKVGTAELAEVHGRLKEACKSWPVTLTFVTT